MSDNVIDPASCGPDKYWLAKAAHHLGGDDAEPARRSPVGRWYLSDYALWLRDEDVTVLSELVRADEAQKTAEWLIEEETHGYGLLLSRQSEQLMKTANVLRGDPPPLTQWSHHDVAERAAAVVAERDHWRSECEKAQTERDEAQATVGRVATDLGEVLAERDELQRRNDRQREGLRQMGEELGEARAGRDSYRDAASICQENVERMVSERDELREKLAQLEELTKVPAVDLAANYDSGFQDGEDRGFGEGYEAGRAARAVRLPDPDPTSAARLRLAAETLEALALGVVAQGKANPLNYGTYPAALRKQADELEAASAREQERDAEIAAVAEILNPDEWDSPESARNFVGELVDALDAHRSATREGA